MSYLRFLCIVVAFVLAGWIGYLRARGAISGTGVGLMLVVVVALVLLSRWKKT